MAKRKKKTKGKRQRAPRVRRARPTRESIRATKSLEALAQKQEIARLEAELQNRFLKLEGQQDERLAFSKKRGTAAIRKRLKELKQLQSKARARKKAPRSQRLKAAEVQARRVNRARNIRAEGEAASRRAAGRRAASRIGGQRESGSPLDRAARRIRESAANKKSGQRAVAGTRKVVRGLREKQFRKFSDINRGFIPSGISGTGIPLEGANTPRGNLGIPLRGEPVLPGTAATPGSDPGPIGLRPPEFVERGRGGGASFGAGGSGGGPPKKGPLTSQGRKELDAFAKGPFKWTKRYTTSTSKFPTKLKAVRSMLEDAGLIRKIKSIKSIPSAELKAMKSLTRVLARVPEASRVGAAGASILSTTTDAIGARMVAGESLAKAISGVAPLKKTGLLAGAKSLISKSPIASGIAGVVGFEAASALANIGGSFLSNKFGPEGTIADLKAQGKIPEVTAQSIADETLLQELRAKQLARDLAQSGVNVGGSGLQDILAQSSQAPQQRAPVSLVSPGSSGFGG